MRTIKYTTQFKRDYKKAKRGQYSRILDDDLLKVAELLVTDKLLPQHMRDHMMIGNWKDHRNCHIKPDLILLYRKLSNNILELVRLGSHSDLGL
jgi:mRNA interferase YafQ